MLRPSIIRLWIALIAPMALLVLLLSIIDRPSPVSAHPLATPHT